MNRPLLTLIFGVLWASQAAFADLIAHSEIAVKNESDISAQTKCLEDLHKLGCDSFKGNPDIRDCSEKEGMAFQIAEGFGQCLGEIQNLGLEAINGFGLEEGIKQSNSYKAMQFDMARMNFLKKCQTEPDCLKSLYRAANGQLPTSDELVPLKNAWFYKLDYLWNRAALKASKSGGDFWLKDQVRLLEVTSGTLPSKEPPPNILKILSEQYSRFSCLKRSAQTTLACGVALTASGIWSAAALAKVPRLARLSELASTRDQAVLSASRETFIVPKLRSDTTSTSPLLSETGYTPISKRKMVKVDDALKKLGLRRDPDQPEYILPGPKEEKFVTRHDGEFLADRTDDRSVSGILRDLSDHYGIRIRAQRTFDIENNVQLIASDGHKTLLLGGGIFDDPKTLKAALLQIEENEFRVRQTQKTGQVIVSDYHTMSFPHQGYVTALPFSGDVTGVSPTSKIIAQAEEKHGSKFYFGVEKTKFADAYARGNDIHLGDYYSSNIDRARSVLMHEITHTSTFRKKIPERNIEFMTSASEKETPFRTGISYATRFRADEVEANIRGLAEIRRAKLTEKNPIRLKDLKREEQNIIKLTRNFIADQRDAISAVKASRLAVKTEYDSYGIILSKEALVHGQPVRVRLSLEPPASQNYQGDMTKAYLDILSKREASLVAYERHLDDHYVTMTRSPKPSASSPN